MKKIVLFIFSLALTIVQATAQYAGREFIRGGASLTFSSTSPGGNNSNYSTGEFAAGVSKGKFLTDQKATGFGLSGGVNFYSDERFRNGQTENSERAGGVRGFSAGAGKFWQFYKHFGEQWGIYGEPSIGAGYTYAKYFEDRNASTYVRTQSNVYQVRFSLVAGAYYQLSRKWWLNTSIGFSNPVSLSFEHRKEANFNSGNQQELPGGTRDNIFRYEIIPNLTLPSVSLGLMYFMR